MSPKEVDSFETQAQNEKTVVVYGVCTPLNLQVVACSAHVAQILALKLGYFRFCDTLPQQLGLLGVMVDVVIDRPFFSTRFPSDPQKVSITWGTP